MMSKKERIQIQIDRKKEMRTKEISKMISEGGLGAEQYYDIKKVNSASKEEAQQDKN